MKDQLPAIKESRYPIVRPRLPMDQSILHIIVLAIGWVTYFGFVYYIFKQHNRDEFKFIFFYLSACIVIVPLLVYLWIRHNIRIYQRKGPRTHVREVEGKYEVDWDGKKIISDWDKVKKANKIFINITETEKEYLINHK